MSEVGNTTLQIHKVETQKTYPRSQCYKVDARTTLSEECEDLPTSQKA
jgi:hypothetical protein